jgi:hypothetical protein
MTASRQAESVEVVAGRRVVAAGAGAQRVANPLDRRGRERTNLLSRQRWRLAHKSLRVARNAARLDRALQDPAEQREALAGPLDRGAATEPVGLPPVR